MYGDGFTPGCEDVVHLLEGQALGAALELDDVGHGLEEVESRRGVPRRGVLRDGQDPGIGVLELNLQGAVVLSIHG